MSEKASLLVVGATGHLGGKVARLALQRGHSVRALVRLGSNADDLAAAGAEVVRGDLLDAGSLGPALAGIDTLVTTAIGYSNRRPGDVQRPTDTEGIRNLAAAARAQGTGRAVFCSILTCERATSVPHFFHKKLGEDAFEAAGVPLVSLRPGAFLDQGRGDFWATGLKRGRLPFIGSPNVPLTFVHTSDVARMLVDAVSIETDQPVTRIDLGCDRPATIVELAELMGSLLGRRVSPQVPPWSLVSAALTVAGIFDPWKRDLRAMMGYIRRGGYVADTALQSRFFGPPPSLESAVERYLLEIGLERSEK
jgi:uncharacterized protein YbjT (DUF2867 family)